MSGCWCTRTGFPLRQPMQEKKLTGLQNSGTDTHPQVLAHLHRQSLGDPACQVCDESLTEGDQLTLYLYKPAGSARYTIGQNRCHSHADDLASLFTLGVRELIVEGRIGQCRDHATQQTWPVLLAPSLRLISAYDTTSGRDVSGDRKSNPNDHAHEWREVTGCESSKPDAISEEHRITAHPNRDGHAEAAESVLIRRSDNE